MSVQLEVTRTKSDAFAAKRQKRTSCLMAKIRKLRLRLTVTTHCRGSGGGRGKEVASANGLRMRAIIAQLEHDARRLPLESLHQCRLAGQFGEHLEER